MDSETQSTCNKLAFAWSKRGPRRLRGYRFDAWRARLRHLLDAGIVTPGEVTGLTDRAVFTMHEEWLDTRFGKDRDAWYPGTEPASSGT